MFFCNECEGNIPGRNFVRPDSTERQSADEIKEWVTVIIKNLHWQRFLWLVSPLPALPPSVFLPLSLSLPVTLSLTVPLFLSHSLSLFLFLSESSLSIFSLPSFLSFPPSLSLFLSYFPLALSLCVCVCVCVRVYLSLFLNLIPALSPEDYGSNDLIWLWMIADLKR